MSELQDLLHRAPAAFARFQAADAAFNNWDERAGDASPPAERAAQVRQRTDDSAEYQGIYDDVMRDHPSGVLRLHRLLVPHRPAAPAPVAAENIPPRID
jgi:hypothetical protein